MRLPFMKETWSMVLPTMAAALAFFAAASLTHCWFCAFLGVMVFVLALLMLNFFRDFERVPVSAPGPREVLSPADGKIVVLRKTVEKFYMKKPMIHIAIFMNPLNNHVQRAPFDGKVIKKVYHPGEFLAAYDDKADLVNEQSHLVLELDKKKGMKAKHRVVLKQIAGLLCRRVKTDAKPGARLKQGERFGRILLGSRVDIFLPVGFKSAVKNGDQVRAGRTVLGELP
ncbi:MAG: phosphatidylserine decarboxylase [bacterium]